MTPRLSGEQIAGINRTEPGLVQVALALARDGYWVHPLESNGKRPLTRHGFHDATRDPDRIRKWWAQTPDANIGIACGASRIVVVDLDVKNGDDGPANWATLADGIDGQPAAVVHTPSGGEHHYWRGGGLANSAGQVAPGVDVRADGGYVVAPGSVIDGVPYRSARDGLPQVADLPALSGPQRSAATSRKAAERPDRGGTDLPPSSSQSLEQLLAQPPLRGTGRANEWLTKVAGYFAAEHRADRGTYETRVRQANTLLDPPHEEVEKVLESIWAREQAKPSPDDRHAQQVAETVERLLVNEDARTEFARIKATLDPAAPFDAGSLRDILAQPTEEAYRVDGLIPMAGSVVIMAKRKTGKTTFNLNLADSLLTGAPFLGQFDTRLVAGAVAILNFEVAGFQLARWAADLGIHEERLFLVNLRGRRNPLTHPQDREALANWLRTRSVETLFVDPFGRAFAGNQNDAGEVSAWLVDLDQFARSEVGASELILNVHAGWNGERSRGSSALEDWPDSIIRLTTRDDDENGPRYMSAIGRDVDVPEDELSFDHESRRLSLTGSGSRRSKQSTEKTRSLLDPLLEIVAAYPGIRSTEIGPHLRKAGVPFQKGAESRALAMAVSDRLLVLVEGRGNARHYYLPGAALELDLPEPPRPQSPRITPLPEARNDGISPGLPGPPQPPPRQSPRPPKRGGETGRYKETQDEAMSGRPLRATKTLQEGDLS